MLYTSKNYLYTIKHTQVNTLIMKYQIEKPADKDLFESSGHSNAAKAIKAVIENQNNIHAIGLEGELGSGKSTVLRLLAQMLPKDTYKFITFDVEQFHYSSTKASFVKHLRDSIIDLFGSDGSVNAKRTRRKAIKAADRALGNDLTYTKKVTSNLSWYTVSFAISLMFAVRYAKDSLTNIAHTIELLLADNFIYTFSLDETITTLLGASPLIVAGVMLYQKLKEKHMPEEDRRVPNIGDIFKRNSLDKITEKLQVTREVGASELKKAFLEMISAVPDDQFVILVIDNLDRVDQEKVREVWSDLETFTSFEGNNLRVIVPFSEKHVAAALSNDNIGDGSEFILKRLPVKFRTPPVVSAGWRLPFKLYWEETLHNYEGIDLCAELIDIWIAPYKQITPRFLKTHINEIAVALASNPEKVSPISCSAYHLAQRSVIIDFKDLISTDNEQTDDNKKQIISWTHKILRKTLSDEEWSSQIMAIHYQTTVDIAKSELLETPLKRAVSKYDIDEVIELSSLFGFNITFQRLLGNIDPYEAVNLAAQSSFDLKNNINWLHKWLPQINLFLKQEKNNCQGYNSFVVESYRELQEAGYTLNTSRLLSEHKKLAIQAEDPQNRKKEENDLLTQIYDLETIIGNDHTPHFISKPKADFFIDELWLREKEFPLWDISDKTQSISLKGLLNCIFERDFHYTNTLISNISQFIKIGQISFSEGNDKSLAETREYSDCEYDDDDYPQVLLASDFCSQSVATSLIQKLIRLENSDFLSEWAALALVSSITSGSLSVSYGNTDQLNYILENFYDKNSQLPYIEAFLGFAVNFNTLLESAKNEDLPDEIKLLIYRYIGQGRVHALNFSSISNTHYPVMKKSLTEEEIHKTLNHLFGWKTHIRTNNNDAILSWNPEFIRDALQENDDWRLFITDWFDSKDHSEKFWLNIILNNEKQLEVITNWYINQDKKLIKSATLTSCIINKQDTFASSGSASTSVNNMMKIISTQSRGKIAREMSKRLLDEQLPNDKKQTLIESFGGYIYLPSFESTASKGIVIHLIENAKSQVVVDWLCEQNGILESINWDSFSNELSQAIKNLTEHFDIKKLATFVLEDASGKLETEDIEVL